jgi:hypothetical protein
MVWGVKHLNERASGAIEALAWVRELLQKAVVQKRDLVFVMDEVEHVHGELLRGVAVDFEKYVLKY